MKRLILLIAAAASLAVTLPYSDPVLAQGRGHRGEQQDRGRETRQDDRRGPDERQGRRDGGRARYLAPDERPGGPRRGGFMLEPPRGAYVDDYPRYRLRPPPRGFAWVRTGDGYALMNLADGRIFDVTPY